MRRLLKDAHLGLLHGGGLGSGFARRLAALSERAQPLLQNAGQFRVAALPSAPQILGDLLHFSGSRRQRRRVELLRQQRGHVLSGVQPLEQAQHAGTHQRVREVRVGRLTDLAEHAAHCGQCGVPSVEGVAGLLRFLIADVDHGLRRVNVASRQQRVRRFIGPAGKLLHNGLRLISRLLIARQLGEDALRLGLLQLHLLDLERRGDGVLQGERAELCHR
jgi:hypothetical protein